jgi:hypothetical protein
MRWLQMQRQEDDVRHRMSLASDAFRKAVLEAQSTRQEYFNSQLPKILRVRSPFFPCPAHKVRSDVRFGFLYPSQLLKQCADEVDLGSQYHLSRYAYLFETVVLQEGTTLTPVDPTEGTRSPLKLFFSLFLFVC